MYRLLTRTEAATYLGVTPSTLDDYHRHGLIPAVKVRRLVRYRLADLQDFVAKHAVRVDP